MKNLLSKYKDLSPAYQKELNDFLDFLLVKSQKHNFNIKEWQSKIRDVSQWSEEDLEVFNENKTKFGEWKTEEW